MQQARDAYDAGIADDNQASSVKKQNAGGDKGRDTMRLAHDADNAGIADGNQADSIKRRQAPNLARAAAGMGKLTADQLRSRDPSLTDAQRLKLKKENKSACERRCREKKKEAKVTSSVIASSAAPQPNTAALAEPNLTAPSALDTSAKEAPQSNTLAPDQSNLTAPHALGTSAIEAPAPNTAALVEPNLTAPSTLDTSANEAPQSNTLAPAQSNLTAPPALGTSAIEAPAPNTAAPEAPLNSMSVKEMKKELISRNVKGCSGKLRPELLVTLKNTRALDASNRSIRSYFTR